MRIYQKLTHTTYGENLLLKGVPIIFNKKGATLVLGDNVTIKSSFLSNLVGLYSRTIIVTRAPGAKIRIGNGVGISGATIYARKGVFKSLASMWEIIARTSPDIKVAIRTDVNCSVYK